LQIWAKTKKYPEVAVGISSNKTLKIYLAVFQDTRSLFFVDDIGQGHSICAEDSCVLVDVDSVHAERASDGASVLATSASEASQNVVSGVYRKNPHFL
jgi:hypothetical protein